MVDHSRLSEPMGGRPAFDRLAAWLAEHCFGAIADVVSNHVAVSTPESLNKVLWLVLWLGLGSSYADWFDVDWGVGN